jgi:hypothetical protein
MIKLLAVLLFTAMPSHAAETACDKKNEIVARLLADSIAEPISVGEFDVIQKRLVRAREIDGDIVRVFVIGSDHDVISSTDPKFLNKKIQGDAWEAAAFGASDLTRRSLADGTTDEAVPIIAAGQRVGLVRITFAKSDAKR